MKITGRSPMVGKKARRSSPVATAPSAEISRMAKGSKWARPQGKRIKIRIRTRKRTTRKVTPSSVIRFEKISRRYQMGSETIHALRDVSLEIQRGQYVAIMGPSGSGKSTLMNLIGCLDTPTSGRYELNGLQVSQMDDNQLAEIRNKEIGFIFQTFNLLPRSDALRNVELPLVYFGIPADERRRIALEALSNV